ncbi:hypothetical protein [Botrimarina hoheduenensis]|uniref:Uncharacterized protein n=1 Tax=Botrimarina hoheduenensis TaxID=2528000 RepID=A0A5C5W732_9BACT|nr:hypothetical protein [Botrimarina hoheduenensis]TWT46500.1 hypothetical protein Pla111_15960 [Botrimarina hoheduenensis]
MLTDQQKREASLVLSVGCDRETAAKYVGCTIEDLLDLARQDERFAATLRRSEAGVELAHMRNIQQAARDERHWRASVWWLERLAPERFGRRDAGAITRRELAGLLSAIATGIAAEVRHEGDRQRVLDKLEELVQTLRDPLLGPMSSADDDAGEEGCPDDDHADQESDDQEDRHE